jgi:hypothetical protein
MGYNLIECPQIKCAKQFSHWIENCLSETKIQANKLRLQIMHYNNSSYNENELEVER